VDCGPALKVQFSRYSTVMPWSIMAAV
jgi:hypothetical protein